MEYKKVFEGVIGLILMLISLLQLGASHPIEDIANVKTHTDQLNESYDYIIVGGGTSGLTVADRLTEDGSKSNPEILTPAIGLTNFSADMYNYTSIPQPGLNNQTAILRGGTIVGGGSSVNSMYFDRGSAEDYDNWEKLSNPGWGWEGMKPYFKKSVTFTPPSDELQSKFDITYNMDAYRGNGPIFATIPPYQRNTTIAQMRGWRDFGILLQEEGANGNAFGVFWVPASLDPKLKTRSYARTGHFEMVSRRSNYHLLTGYQANTILFGDWLQANGLSIQPRFITTVAPQITNVFAAKEVILATGAIGTPLLHQRSGIGPKRVIEHAGIRTLLDLPGVGQNLQDHAVFAVISLKFTSASYPNHDMLANNATFLAESLAEYHQNKTGPILGCDRAGGAFLPLPMITSSYQSLTDEFRAQSAPQYLAPDPDPTPSTGRSGGAAVLLKPLSRGSINVDPAAPHRPIIDFSVVKNPVDLMIFIESFKLLRNVYSSPALVASLHPVETSPGLNVSTDEQIAAWLHRSMLPSAAHPCGTAAMMPSEIGGVVAPDLLVHGVRGLSVVDASIIPLIPGTHLSATVYAVAEKAADIIKGRAEVY